MSIIVTGASRGIGKSVAKSLASAGHGLVLAARDMDALEEVRRGLVNPEKHEIKHLDFNSFDPANWRFKTPIKGLVNSAGIAPAGLLAAMSAKQIENCFQVNTLGPILLTKALIKQMLRSGGGSFVYLSSVLAHKGSAGMGPYGSSKAAIEAFCRAMAREIGSKGFNFNCVAPGLVDTDMGRAASIDTFLSGCVKKEILDPEEIASTVKLVLENRAINGQVIKVDNGLLA